MVSRRAALAALAAGVVTIVVLIAAPFAISLLRDHAPAARSRSDDSSVNLAYRVTVVFDWLTVHNNREGLLSGNGEFDVVANVQGIKVGLTDASETEGSCAGWSCPHFPLMGVDDGETVTFAHGTEVTVNLSKTFPCRSSPQESRLMAVRERHSPIPGSPSRARLI